MTEKTKETFVIKGIENCCAISSVFMIRHFMKFGTNPYAVNPFASWSV